MNTEKLCLTYGKAAIVQNLPYEQMTIKNLLGEQVYYSLKDCRAVLAGGALTSILSGKEVNDFDIYWKDRESFSEFLIGVYGKNPSLDLSIHSIRINHYTDKSILLQTQESNEEDQENIQLIGMRVFVTISDIFDSFDFTINMAAFDFGTETFYLHPDCLKDIAQRRLVVNENTSYPFTTVLRVEKYKERGYTISKAQMIKLLLAVNAKEMDSWDKLKEELGGLYGLDADEAIDDSEEFSIENAMGQLSTLFTPKKYVNKKSNPESSTIAEQFKHMLTEEAFEFLNTARYIWDVWKSEYEFCD